MAIYENTGILAYKDMNGDIQRLYPRTKVDCVDGIETVLEHLNNTSNPHEVSLEDFGVAVTADEINLLSGVKSNLQEQLDQLSVKIDASSGDADANTNTIFAAMKEADDALAEEFDSKMDEHTTAMTKLIDVKANQEVTLTIELPASDWADVDGVFTQQVSVAGVTADNTVIVSAKPDPITSYVTYAGCCVVCSGQATDTLTFICAVLPEISLYANVAILNAA